MLKIFLWAVEIFVGFLLAVIVLVQVGRRSELGAAFGGTSQSIFGPTGPTTILEKATYVLVAIFMISTFAIAKLSSKPETAVKLRPAAPAIEVEEIPEEMLEIPLEETLPELPEEEQ
jgi:preprotein translocase subunit SecG